MNEPTLDDAKEAIERTKAARPMCSECSTFDIAIHWHVTSGKHPPLVEDELHADLRAAVHAQLGPSWDLVPHSTGFAKRCEKCAAEPLFAWANRLDAEKVLAFMRSNPDCFWLGALEQTL